MSLMNELKIKSYTHMQLQFPLPTFAQNIYIGLHKRDFFKIQTKPIRLNKANDEYL